MAEKVQFFPIDFNYEVDGGKPVVKIYGRTKEGSRICVLDDSFSPYFWVIPKKGAELNEKIEKISIQLEGSTASVTKTESVDRKFLEKDVKAIKVFTGIPKDIPAIREVVKDWDMVESTNEFDVLFVRRYSIDKGIVPMMLHEAEGSFTEKKMRCLSFKADSITQSGAETLQNPKILAIDIETYSKFDEGINFEKNPIIMISFYGDNFKKVLVWKKFSTDDEYVEFVESEAELLGRFAQIVGEYQPEIIAGYYSDGFDMPYIKARAEKNKVKLDIGMDYSGLRIGKSKISTCSIEGITHIDIFKFIKKTTSMALDSYNLNSVASRFLGEKKQDVDLENLHKIWDMQPELLGQFCRYNLHDSKLVYNLTEKMLPAMIEMVKIAGLPLFEVNRAGYSQLVEWYIMRQAYNHNEIAPNKPSNQQIAERIRYVIQGAFVYEPKPGFYKDIVVFDYRSLYPTIISSHNISHGTLKCECCPNAKRINPNEKTEYWFCEKRNGLVPTLVSDLITKRIKIKDMIKERKEDDYAFLDARQNSLKLLANSFYGYLGFYAARWYSMECAQSVTALGRFYIQQVIKKASESGFDVLYSDTDSVFLALRESTKEDSVKFVEGINAELPGLMELDFEGFYPSGIFVSAKAGEYGAKKKYALLREDGTLKIRGFETVRRNWSNIAKEVQENILNIILKENDTKKAAVYVKQIIKELRDKEVPVEKMIIHTQLQKDIKDYAAKGPHVAVAQRMKNMGKSVGPGTVIKYIVVQGNDIIRNRSKLPEEVSQQEYDAEYYINNQVIPAVERIFAVLGHSKEELMEDKKQHTLGKYFG